MLKLGCPYSPWTLSSALLQTPFCNTCSVYVYLTWSGIAPPQGSDPSLFPVSPSFGLISPPGFPPPLYLALVRVVTPRYPLCHLVAHPLFFPPGIGDFHERLLRSFPPFTHLKFLLYCISRARLAPLNALFFFTFRRVTLLGKKSSFPISGFPNLRHSPFANGDDGRSFLVFAFPPPKGSLLLEIHF